MSGFSGALKLTDLDDFITPSQVSFFPHRIFVEFKQKLKNDEIFVSVHF